MADKGNALIDWLAAKYNRPPNAPRTVRNYLRDCGMVDMPLLHVGQVLLLTVCKPIDRNVSLLIDQLWKYGVEVLDSHDYRAYEGPFLIAIRASELVRLIKED